MFFAGTWALIMGLAVFFRFDGWEHWQDLLIIVIYSISAALFLIAVVFFRNNKERAAKIVSLLGYYPGLLVGSTVQGGGNSVLILIVVSVAFTMMYGFMVEPKTTRNRFLLYGLGFVALNLGLYFVPFPFRLIILEGQSGNAGIPITIATGIVAFFLILTQARQGVRLFRRSTGFKLGVGFAVTTLVTIGFMVFAITVLTRVSVDFDYTRYADNEQVYVNDLSAEVRGMRVHLNEYLLNYNTEGLDEAHSRYYSEYANHYRNAGALFEEFETLHQEGWGFYIPGEEAQEKANALLLVRSSLDTFNSLVEDLIVLITQRGFKDIGLEGELRQEVQALESAPAIQQHENLEVLFLRMRQHEKDWVLRQAVEDAESVNALGAQAISLLRTLEISAADRLTAEGNITSYLKKFNQAVDIDKQISAKLAEINIAVDPINPWLEDIKESAALEVETAQARLVDTETFVQNAAVSFGVGALIIAGLTAFLTTRTIVRPITSLTSTAAKLAEGNLNVRSDLNAEDETGRLAGVFNQMAERLQSTLASLEETVAERTAELQERAQEMEASQRVTFAASERTSPEDFLELLVNLLVDQFDIYHAQVYLLDTERKNAVLSQSTGYAGRVLLQHKHHIPLERESLVTRCINSGEPVLVANTQEEEGWLPNDLLPYTQSELVVPLKVEGAVIGALDIQDRVASRFTDATVPVFESMTEQVSFLYQNNELLEEIESSRSAQERFAKQLATAAFIANQLSAILDMDQLLNQAVTMMQSQFNLYHAHIYLLDEAKENLVVQVGSGHVGVILKERSHSISVNKEQSLVARAFRDRLPVLVEDVTEAPDHLPNPLLPDTRSELAVPLVSRGEVIGVLDIQDEEVGRFTEVDANTMNTLAVQLATAIENAQLFKQAEQERERFRVLIDTAPEAIVVFNGETGEFYEANQNAVELYEIPMKELIGNNPIALSPEIQPDGRPSAEAAMEFIQEAIEGGSPVFEWVHRTGTGKDVACEVHLVRLPGYDHPPRLRGSVMDITDRKAAQSAIIEGDKLKSEFLANMSHELRTPLNSIVGYTDVLLMGIDGDLNDEMLLDVQAIQENSQLLLKIINDILDLAKIEAKRVIFEVSKVDVKGVLENVVRNNAGLLVNKPVEMKVDVASQLPAVEVDAVRLEQILNNLVSNAVKFTEKGHITLRAFTEADWMVLQVEDTGSGISEEDLQVIFEEFRQADGSQTRTAEGTGLGLTITRRLVHMHSGTIAVESEVGKGTVFTVQLPLEANINPEVTVKKANEQAHKPATKLVEPAESHVTKPLPDLEPESKGNGKGNGRNIDLVKASAELLGNELKEAAVSSEPNRELSYKEKTAKNKGENHSKDA
jgi:PAS domain S-box-containing protein